MIPYEGNPAVSQATPGYDAEVAKAYAYDPGQGQPAARRGRLDGAERRRGPDQGRQAADASSSSTAPAFIFTQEGATVLQVLQEQWKQVGFDVKLIPATQAELWGGKYSDPRTYDATPSYWTSPSPAILWIVWRPSTPDNPNGNNRSFYNNDALSQVIQQANTEPDAAKANALYGQAQKIIQDDAAGIGLYTQNSTVRGRPEPEGRLAGEEPGRAGLLRRLLHQMSGDEDLHKAIAVKAAASVVVIVAAASVTFFAQLAVPGDRATALMNLQTGQEQSVDGRGAGAAQRAGSASTTRSSCSTSTTWPGCSTATSARRTPRNGR